MTRLRAFFGSPGDPLNLAVFRITVFALIGILFCRIDFIRLAALPPELRVPPTGYGSFFHLIPWNLGFVRGVQAIGVVACLSAGAGVASRAAALIACLCALYLFGLPQMFGKVSHMQHHLVWFAALLAAAPAGDALSIDALRAARRGGGRASPAVAYGLPLRCAWLLIGIAYWFAGLAKLRAGPEWIFSENLKLLMYSFWAERNFVPLVRIDRYPVLYEGAAAATVAFELGLLPALFFPRLRPLAVVGGVFFHVMSAVYLRIFFTPLLACYVVFVDWAALWRAARERRLPSRFFVADQPVPAGEPGRARTERGLVGTAVVASLLLTANAYCGARRIDSWPFSVYPRFDSITRNDEVRSLEVIILRPDGTTVRLAPVRDPALARLLRTPAGQREAVLSALAPQLRDKGFAAGDSLQISEVARSSVPEERDAPPRRRTLLGEITN